jgi:ABC-type Fe3+-hydroxamate transport system substrate-binding protein
MNWTDQMNNTIALGTHPPQRIVSLVPSQTELLYDLGLSDEVVGITKFCVHPNLWFRNKTRVGGTKKIKPEVIHDLAPDLIIGNKEENTKEDIDYLRQHYPVWMSDIVELQDALHMIREVGDMIAKPDAATQLIHQINTERKKLPTPSRRPSVAYFIWRNPWMVVGNGTYIHSFLEGCGFKNAFEDEIRYPEVQLESLKAREIDYLFLSSEPFPFKQKHANEIQEFLPDTKIRIVDGEMFSWYGSRMSKGFRYANQLIREQLDDKKLNLSV